MIIRKKCRICKGKLKKIISFNKITLVGFFYKKIKKQKKYPISLNFCINCKHVQIAEIINPKKLFSKYLWETGLSKSNYQIFDQIIKTYRHKLNKQSKVFEIASNDGSFLRYLKKKIDCDAYGIDPASNLIKKEKKISQIKGFFSSKESKKILKKYGRFDFIFARNVLAHVTEPNEIFKGIKNLLKVKGCAVIEVPHLLPIIKNLQYDNIFHEHQGFHSIKSIYDLCKRNNLYLNNIKKINSQGGSIRCEIKKNYYKNKHNKKIKNFINNEKREKLFDKKFLLKFKSKVFLHQKKLFNLLKKLKLKNKKISIYGASGKGQALLQFCNIDSKLIDKVYDKSKLKMKQYTPGTNIYIENPSKINRDNIDFLFLSSWNIKDEIINQERNFIKNGGKIILPFPYPKIIRS